MNDKEDRYEVIPIQKNHNLRYAIYDNKTKFIVDDANNWGFKTKESAQKILNWKYKNINNGRNKDK